jgi:hypothetical protein
MNKELLDILGEQLQRFESDLLGLVEEQKTYIGNLEKRIAELEQSAPAPSENNDPPSWIEIDKTFWLAGVYDKVSYTRSKIVVSGESTERKLWIKNEEGKLEEILEAIGGNSKSAEAKRSAETQKNHSNTKKGMVLVADLDGKLINRRLDTFPVEFQREFYTHLTSTEIDKYHPFFHDEIQKEIQIDQLNEDYP